MKAWVFKEKGEKKEIMINKIEGYLFPKGVYCVVCGKYIDHTRTYGLCDHCIEHINFDYTKLNTGKSVDYGLAAMGYGLYERRLIFNLKYDGDTYLAPIIADILYDCIYSMVAKGEHCPLIMADVIIPVPVHKNKLKERGFNQTEKIAKHLGRKLSMEVDAKTLLRVKETKKQRALSAEDRKLNLEQAFQINLQKKRAINNKKVILLDDIYTTGATVNSCAELLKAEGAEKIYALTLLFAGNRHHLMIK